MGGPVKRRIAAGQRRDVHVRNGREMVAGLTAKRKVRIMVKTESEAANQRRFAAKYAGKRRAQE